MYNNWHFDDSSTPSKSCQLQVSFGEAANRFVISIHQSFVDVTLVKNLDIKFLSWYRYSWLIHMTCLFLMFHYVLFQIKPEREVE